MGASMRLYVGPCVRCPNPNITGPVEVPGCPKCQREIREAFCGFCGSRKGTFTKTATRLKVEDLDLNDRLILHEHDQKNLDIYIPDSKAIPGIKRLLVYDTEYDQPSLTFTEEQIRDEIVEFIVNFNQEITKIKEAYGDYKVQWATFHWINA